MILLFFCLAWLIAVALLITGALIQYSAYEKITPQQKSDGIAATVAVIVPARNEEGNIGRCVQSLLRQNYPEGQLRIFIVDDGSTDDTPDIVRQFAEHDSRLQFIQGTPPGAGWKGKPSACWQGAKFAGERFDWLCFIDADTASEPELLISAIGVAEERKADMLSLEPFQVLNGFANRLIMPAGFFFAAFTQDLRRVNDPRKSDAFANGQFILIRRRVYETVGGHSAVRGEMAEDSALARVVKGAGNRLLILGGDNLIRTRMYSDLASLWEGIGRSLVEMAGGPRRLMIFAAAALLLSLASIMLPVWGWLAVASQANAVDILAAICASIGSASLLGVHIGAAHYFRIPFWYGFLFPVAYMIGAILAMDSLYRQRIGRVAWKGRVYSHAT